MIAVVIIILLLVITYEDLKYRSVRSLLFPALAILLLINRILLIGLGSATGNLLINLTYIIFLTSVIIIYIWIRQKQLVNPFDNFIGLGDVFFLLALACWFKPLDFMIFTVISFIVALATGLIFKELIRFKNHGNIPLAGIQSVCFLVVFIDFHFLHQLNAFD